MKFMKLGNRPDTFFTTEAIRSVSSEVSTDLQIQVQKSLYHLHRFPLLSKCLRLQQLCSELGAGEVAVVRLADFPGGVEAFEVCAKFCYGITVTLSAFNVVPVWCAAHYLRMTEDADSGNLLGKLDVFFRSCILRRWKDTLMALQSTRQHAPPLCEELGVTGRCVDAVATAVIANPQLPGAASGSWWANDLSELCVDHYWRVMVSVKSAGIVPAELVGEALQVYARRWLPIDDGGRDATAKQKQVMEKIVSLLPPEKGSLSCSFLLKLLKAANFLRGPSPLKLELARRVGLQLEEATVDDLLIPSNSGDTLYDVDLLMSILNEFLLQGQSPATTPPREKLKCERRQSRSAEFKGRRSSSASHSSKLRVAKLIDGYLQEIARDKNLTMEKLISVAEAVPDFARVDHDDLYRVIDIYLRLHPELDKNARKKLCRLLDCKKLSVEACMEAAQNELLPLRVVVQVLFFEQSRAAMSGCQVTELPGNIKALLAKAAVDDKDDEASKAVKLCHTDTATPLEERWRISRLKCPTTKFETLKMKLAEEDDDEIDYNLIPCKALSRSASSRLRALCSFPEKPKRIIRKFLTMNRSDELVHPNNGIYVTRKIPRSSGYAPFLEANCPTSESSVYLLKLMDGKQGKVLQTHHGTGQEKYLMLNLPRGSHSSSSYSISRQLLYVMLTNQTRIQPIYWLDLWGQIVRVHMCSVAVNILLSVIASEGTGLPSTAFPTSPKSHPPLPVEKH